MELQKLSLKYRNQGSNILTKKNKKNLIMIILEYLSLDEVLIASGVNSILFNIARERGSSTFAVVLSKYKPIMKNSFIKLQSIYKTVLERENCNISHIFQLFSLLISKYFFKTKFELSFNNYSEYAFIYNILNNVQLTNECYSGLTVNIIKVYEENSQKIPELLNCMNESKSLFHFLRHLNISENKISDSNIVPLINILKNKNSKLESIIITGNFLGEGWESKELLRLLVNNKSIKYINLSFNNFKDDSIDFFVNIMDNNNKIRSIEANYNKFTIKGIKKVFEYFNNKYEDNSDCIEKNFKKFFNFSFINSPKYMIASDGISYKSQVTFHIQHPLESFYSKYLEGLKIKILIFLSLPSCEVISKLFENNASNVERISLYFDISANYEVHSATSHMVDLLSSNRNLFINLKHFLISCYNSNYNFRFRESSTSLLIRALKDIALYSLNSLTLENLNINLEIIQEISNILSMNKLHCLNIMLCNDFNNYYKSILVPSLKNTMVKEINITSNGLDENAINFFKNYTNTNTEISLSNVLNK